MQNVTKLVFPVTKEFPSPNHFCFGDASQKRMAIGPLAQPKPKNGDKNKCHKSSGPTQAQPRPKISDENKTSQIVAT